MNIGKVLKEELKLISLSNEEVLVLNGLAKDIISILKKGGLNAEVGGSLAKGTLIKKEKQDIDLFVKFRDENDIGKLADFLDKTDLNIERIHGSRDYFHVLSNSVIVELIPVVSFDEPAEAKNVTDFSLLHVNYVKKKMKNKKLADEIKLAKTFCHAQGCYGAESYIKGFSGYALELLILHYGSFVKFLKEIVKAKGQLVIDPEKKFKKNEVLRELNESKLFSPIILIDPTYKYRNATAGLSVETFEKIKKSAKEFLKKPSLEFFKEKKIDVEGMKRKAKASKAKFIEIEFKTNKQEGDIAATKMKKFFDFIVSNLERKEQKIVAKEFDYQSGQNAKGYLIIKECKEIEFRGPPVKMKEASQAFKRFHRNAVAKKGFLFAKVKIDLEDIFAQIKQFEEEMDVRFEIIN